MREKWIEISKYRMKKSLDDYIAAERNFKESDYDTVANRAYYSVFHMMAALLILKDMNFKKHSSVISAFRKEYIKTGIFDKKLSNIISKTSELRNESDYADNVLRDKRTSRRTNKKC